MVKNKKTWIYGCFTILMGIIIFAFSAQPGDESGKTSGLIVQLIQAVFGEGVLGESLHFLVRKAAHVTVYFLFGLCATCFWTSYFTGGSDICSFNKGKRLLEKLTTDEGKLWIGVGFGVLTSFLYACSDEWHQMFVIGRSGSFRDVLIDGIGFVTAAVVVVVKQKLCYNKK